LATHVRFVLDIQNQMKKLPVWMLLDNTGIKLNLKINIFKVIVKQIFFICPASSAPALYQKENSVTTLPSFV